MIDLMNIYQVNILNVLNAYAEVQRLRNEALKPAAVSYCQSH
jgi:hypothetical protein